MPSKIFINYRREDSKGEALALRQYLERKLPHAQLFMDIDGGIRGGENFVSVLDQRVAGSDLFLCVIGTQWLTTKDASGERRIDSAGDFVRVEIAAALKRDIPIIPVILDDARMPTELELPADIKLVAYKQALRLRHDRFNQDAEGIVAAVRAVLTGRRPSGTPTWVVAACVAGALLLGGVAGLYGQRLTGFNSSESFAAYPDEAELRRKLSAVDAQLKTAREAAESAKSERRDMDMRLKATAAELSKAREGLATTKRAAGEAGALEGQLKAAREELERERTAKRGVEQRLAQAVASSGASSKQPEIDKRLPDTRLCDGVQATVGKEKRCLQLNQPFQDCPECPEMVLAPSGSFTLGSPPSEPERMGDEHSVNVVIANAFAVGRFAVTRDEFETFAKATNYTATGQCVGVQDMARPAGAREQSRNYSYRDPGFVQTGKHPVVCVNWTDAQAYLAWLSHRTGHRYRLLSEAEREYVTRAGTKTAFWWGPSISPTQANYDGYVAYPNGSTGQYREGTVAVDSFQPNAWGLYNVHGNVFELTEDCWNDSNIGHPGTAAPRATGDCRYRVGRGGSWNQPPKVLRSASRAKSSAPEQRDNNDGFRVARTLMP